MTGGVTGLKAVGPATEDALVMGAVAGETAGGVTATLAANGDAIPTGGLAGICA